MRQSAWPSLALRARCLQSKMQIHGRVSGFSRKIEQIIAPAPFVTNPPEKFIFSPKRISPSRAAGKTMKAKCELCRTEAILQNRNETHFGEVVGKMWVKITLGELQRKLKAGAPHPDCQVAPALADRHAQIQKHKYKIQTRKYTNTQIHKYEV